MRYRDAQHVDVGAFYSRSPRAGKVYRIIGHCGVAAAAATAWAHDSRAAVALLIALIVVWFAAWWQVVGTLWRASIVAGIVVCAVELALDRCGCGAHQPPMVAAAGSAP